MKNKGITLIALVITIIILLILASVSIGMVLGDNGIISQAQKAVEATKQATEDEQQEISKLLDMMGKTAEDITKNDYGAYVTYNLDLNKNNDLTDDWRIFYSDGTHIFLISADYCADKEKLDICLNKSGMTPTRYRSLEIYR